VANATEIRRFIALADMGCIVCRLYFDEFRPSEVHHITDCGRRVGHKATIPLCVFHHRGVPDSHMSRRDMMEILGPSLSGQPRSFKDRFGTFRQLLNATNALLGPEPH
jgi:hypothetical protein